jgi:hypothetical protein
MSKTENGSSLLMVLLIVTIFSILGLSLIGINLNTSKQVARTGNDLRATNLAEMGVVHIKEEFHGIIKGHKIQTLSGLLNQLLGIEKHKIQVGNKQYYEFESGHPAPVYREGALIAIRYPFTSIGTSVDTEKTISGDLVISLEFPLRQVGIDLISGKRIYKQVGGLFDLIFEDDVYYSDGFAVQSNTDLTYELDLFSQGEITMTSNSDIIVKGDAYVNDLYLTTTGGTGGNQANQSLMCVEGTLTIFGTIPEGVNRYEGETMGEEIDCDRIASENNNSGIFATKIIFKSFWAFYTEAEYK